MNRFTFYLYLLTLTVITGCSDSSSGTNSADNLASVNAGADLTVFEGETISLEAVVYPEGGSVTWTQVSGEYIEDFPVEGSLTAEVIAPSVNIDSTLVFQAEYTSLDGQIAYDEISIEITNVDYAPIAIITLEDESNEPFTTYQEVTLSGQSSYDQDGEIREYLWEQIDTNKSLTFLSDNNSSELQFRAPFVSELTTFTIQLTVTDNEEIEGVNTLDVQVSPSSADILANAGTDQAVDEFTTVTLDASDSGSAISEISCSWEQTFGTDVMIENTDACITSFIAGDINTEEDMVFTVTVTDSANNTAEDSVVVVVTPVDLGLLHDTGIDKCYNNSEEIDCGDTDHPMQDGDTGRDVVGDLLDKSGTGVRSYDFTKLDENADELPNDALVFSCVRDNFTGLIWEVKQAPTIPEFGNLRGAENYYSFDDSQDALLSCPSDASCGQEDYVDSVNEQIFCGGANWRLPTYLELLNLLDYNDLDRNNLLPEDFFVETPDVAALGHKFYWVSDASAEGGTDERYLVIDLATGDDSAILYSQTAYVILVRTP